MVVFRAAPRVLVVGLGKSGVAAARLAAADGSEVWLTDLRPESELAAELDQLSGEERTFLGGHPIESLEGVGSVIVSPGVPADAPLLEEARDRDIQVTTEVEFAWFHRPSAPLVAVTGSNGKSTTTELVARMLCETGKSAVAGGNLGTPASELVQRGGWESWVLEISSFQAELLRAMQPRVSVFLNLSQDHLERHPSMASYLEAKRRIFAFQGPHDLAVLNADDEATATTPTVARKRLFSVSGPADAYYDGAHVLLDGEVVIAASEVRLSGLHNLANTLAAALAASALGASTHAIASTVSIFDGLEHRHRTVHECGGVRWVDDSKATNVGATAAALRGYDDGAVHLILGGQGKGQDFRPLVEEVRRSAARVYLIGDDGAMIGELLDGVVPVENCVTLDEAVSRARAHAEPGQWVLLAPACASFDQFANYGERGDAFAKLARKGVAACP
jgi:UDP-N-acetylmuramoylalanine--D-glutamate ligase